MGKKDVKNGKIKGLDDCIAGMEISDDLVEDIIRLKNAVDISKENGELNKDDGVGSNLLMSEIFGNTKGGALYIMRKDVADGVYSVTHLNRPGTNNGPATRTDSKNGTSGLVTVNHYTMAGYLGYLSMVFDALDDIIADPTINRHYYVPRGRGQGQNGGRNKIIYI
ncbi:MAG: hypothetical protein K6D97_04155 [Clostridia bacterium]|nr:hypothetical protein [Clostridia bacterium]